MNDVSSACSGTDLFAEIRELAATHRESQDTAKQEEIAYELGAKLLAAQNEQSTLLVQNHALLTDNQILLETNVSLQVRIAELEDWSVEKQRYEMKVLPPGVLVYGLKQGSATGEPPHYICPTCYHRGKKRPLHSLGAQDGIEEFRCHECGTQLTTGRYQRPHAG